MSTFIAEGERKVERSKPLIVLAVALITVAVLLAACGAVPEYAGKIIVLNDNGTAKVSRACSSLVDTVGIKDTSIKEGNCITYKSTGTGASFKFTGKVNCDLLPTCSK